MSESTTNIRFRDTSQRSIAKTITWRIFGSVDTLLFAWLILGDISAGLKVMGVDFFVKLILYYWHERLWNLISWGRENSPTHMRSIAKAISWRVVGTLSTIVVAFFTGANPMQALKIGTADLLSKFILYYLHERMWSKIKWGRIIEYIMDDVFERVTVHQVVEIAKKAGQRILHIYENEDFSKTIDFKEDNSPLTIADKQSHDIIYSELKKLDSYIPVMSEEGKDVEYKDRESWEYFWCVDPLDGTKEFIKKNGQFAVNIALVKNGVPILGVIYAPVLKTAYFAVAGDSAFKQVQDQEPEEIMVNDKKESRIAVRSASHPSPEEEELFKQHKVTDTMSAGSALKFCMVAEGKADIYYRHGPTMEWDTAAGQAIVEAANGTMVDEYDKRFHYNKQNLRNGSFLVKGFN